MVDQNAMQEYQAFAQQYQMVAMQKQSLEAQKAEIDNSLAELDNAKGKVFYAAGSVLLESTKDDVKAKLEKQKKDAVDAAGRLETQEKKIKTRLEELDKKLRGSEDE